MNNRIRSGRRIKKGERKHARGRSVGLKGRQ